MELISLDPEQPLAAERTLASMLVKDRQAESAADIRERRQDFALHDAAATGGRFGVIEIALRAVDFALPDGAGVVVPRDSRDGARSVLTALRPLSRYGSGAVLRADEAATLVIIEQILFPHPERASLYGTVGEWAANMHLSSLHPLS